MRMINLSLKKLKLITKSRPVVLQEVCERFIGAKEFIKDKIEKICNKKKNQWKM